MEGLTMTDKDIVLAVQKELEYRIRTAVARYRAAANVGQLQTVVDEEVQQGKAAVANLLREPVDVEALAVGTTFRAPHINMAPDTERLWVRSGRSIMDVSMDIGGVYLPTAVDPRKVRNVQPPAEDDE